jgi:FkbM family methyltransferase
MKLKYLFILFCYRGPSMSKAESLMADFSAYDAARSSFIWGMNIVRGLVFKSRFLHVSVPFLRRQYVYDREHAKLVRLNVRNKIDFNVLRQIFVEHGYDTKIHPDIKARYDAIIESGRKPLIIDCGANSGMATRYFVDTFPGAKAVAIEPDRENLELARRNNPSGEVDFRLAGVSAQTGKARLERENADNWGYQTELSENGDVEMVTINSILKDHEDCVPFLIKIDIEGFESDLFSANTEWVDRFPVIIMELHDWMLPGECNSMNFLKVIAGRNRDFLLRGENVLSIDVPQSRS